MHYCLMFLSARARLVLLEVQDLLYGMINHWRPGLQRTEIVQITVLSKFLEKL